MPASRADRGISVDAYLETNVPGIARPRAARWPDSAYPDRRSSGALGGAGAAWADRRKNIAGVSGPRDRPVILERALRRNIKTWVTRNGGDDVQIDGDLGKRNARFAIYRVGKLWRRTVGREPGKLRAEVDMADEHPHGSRLNGPIAGGKRSGQCGAIMGADARR